MSTPEPTGLDLATMFGVCLTCGAPRYARVEHGGRVVGTYCTADPDHEAGD